MDTSYQTIRIPIPVSEKYGSVSAEIFEPASFTAILAIGHGAGSTLDQPFLAQLASALAAQGICTLRYNFFYSENKKKMPDRFPVASLVVQAVIDYAANRYPNISLFAGGKSFGGRMTSMTLAESNDPRVKGIVFFGFPLHPAGSPGVERAEHLTKVQIPMLFLQGTKDELAYPDLLRPIIANLPAATLIEFQGADHSFKGGKQTSVDAISSASSSWINGHI
jgi:uncharacterized protein